MRAHENTVSCLCFANFISTQTSKGMVTRKCVVSGGFDGKIIMYDITLFKKAGREPIFVDKVYAHECEILCVFFNEMDGTILSGGNDGVIKVWEKVFPTQMKSIGEMKGHTLGVTSIVRD